MSIINTLVLHRVVKDEVKNFEDITEKTLALMLKKEPYSFTSIEDAFNKLCPIKKPICLTFDDGFSSDIDITLPQLQSNHAVATFFIVRDYLNKSGYMTKDQVIQLSKNGMQIGSHSLSHPNFLDINSRIRRDELISSKDFLEDLLCKEVTTFSFPFGFSNDRCIDEVFSAGYKFCCTSRHGIANVNSRVIPRNSINGKMKISQIYRNMRPSLATRLSWSAEDAVKSKFKDYAPELYPKIRDFVSKL